MFKEKLAHLLDRLSGDLNQGLPKDMLGKYPQNCFILKRAMNYDEMESEDDEKYDFFTIDYKISARLDRFQTRLILSKFGPQFNSKVIDSIIKMVWNFPKLLINKETAEFEPFNDTMNSLPPLPTTGGPPVKTVFINR